MSQTVYRLKHAGIGPSAFVKQSEPIPTPRVHEVLIRVHAVSLNYRDVAISRGEYSLHLKDDLVPVGDLAGEVVTTGDATTRFKKGDRVTAIFDQECFYGAQSTWAGILGGSVDGALQEYIALPELTLLPIPKHLSYEEASCFPIAGVTAWNALYGGTPLRPGDVAVFTGTGGVSILGLIFAHAAGAITIVTSSSDEKLELAKKLGADHVINYKTTPDWGKKVKELTNGVGAHHVFDNAGINDIEQCFDSVARGGTISAIGFLGGKPTATPNVPLLALMTYSTLRGINVGSKQLFEDMLRFVQAKELRPYIDQTFPFDKSIEALEYLERGQHFGKVVVRVSPPGTQ